MNERKGVICDFEFLASGDGRRHEIESQAVIGEGDVFGSGRWDDAIERDRAVTDALRNAFAGALREGAPPHLLAALEAPGQRHGGRIAIAAAAAAFVFGWFLSAQLGPPQPPPAYVELLDSVGEDVAGIAPASNAPKGAPDMSRYGFKPVAADELAVDNRRLNRVLYRGAGGEALDVIASPLAPEPLEPVLVKRTTVGAAAYWAEDGIAYRASGNMAPARLRTIAEALRGEIAEIPDRPKTLAGLTPIQPAPPPSPAVAGAPVLAQGEETHLPREN